MDGRTDGDSSGGAPGGDETAEFLATLLARGDGAARIGAGLWARLGTALAHCTELHAMRQRKGPAGPVGHRVSRHVFLLADGGHAMLWEVEHNTDPDGLTRYRLYAEQAQAEGYARARFGEPPLLDLWPRLGADSGFDPDLDPDPGPDLGPGDTSDVFGSILGSGSTGPYRGSGPCSDADFVAGAAAAFDPLDDSGSDLGRAIAEIFFSARRAEQHRSRRGRHARHDHRTDAAAAEHARRLLRRAENADRPGETVRQLLTSAVGHETTLVTLRSDTGGDFAVEWALYEHAFQLADGGRISLWELEHTITPDGHPVCEVYLDEATARDSVDRHRAGS